MPEFTPTPRSRNWTAEAWQNFFERSLHRKEQLSNLSRHVAFDFLDLSEFDWLQNCIGSRCDLAAGAVLTAEALGLIGPRNPLGVMGSGPSALFATLTALCLGIPVTLFTRDVTDEGVHWMLPLSQCPHRFVSPSFYERALPSYWPSDDSPWIHSLAAFTFPVEEYLKFFVYSEEPAADIAQRWAENFADLVEENGWNETLFRSVVAPRKDVSFDAQYAIRAFTGMSLVINCRLFDEEKLHLGDKTSPTYTSFAYWSKEPEEWLAPRARVMISGAGDGALQDFSRFVFQWKKPSEMNELLLPKRTETPAPYIKAFDRVNELAVRNFRRLQQGRALWASIHQQHRLRPTAFLARLIRREEERKFSIVHMVHEQMTHLADAVADEIDLGPLCAKPSAGPYLHTRTEVLGPCFPHNHLIGLLAFKALRSRGYEPRHIDPQGPRVSFETSHEFDRTSAAQCAEIVRRFGGLTATAPDGKDSYPLDHLIIRHAPIRHGIMRANALVDKHEETLPMALEEVFFQRWRVPEAAREGVMLLAEGYTIPEITLLFGFLPADQDESKCASTKKRAQAMAPFISSIEHLCADRNLPHNGVVKALISELDKIADGAGMAEE